MTFKKYATHSVLSLMIAGTALVHPYGAAFAASPPELSAQCTQARADVASHQKTLETLKARHSELMKKLDAEKEARTQAEHKLAELEAVAMDKKAEISTAHQQIERATARIEELTSAIARLDNEIAEHAKALAAATQELANAQRKLDSIATAHEQARAKVEQANELVRQAQSSVASAEKALQDEKERYTSAVAEQARRSAQTEQELKKVTEQLATAPQTLVELNDRLTKAQAEQNKATERLNLLRKVSEEKDEKARDATKVLEGVVAQKDEEMALKNMTDAEIKKLDDEIAELPQIPENTQKVAELTARRQSQLRMREGYEGNITDLNNLVTKIRSDIAELEEEIRKFAAEILVVEQKLQTAIRDAAQAEQAILDQRSTIDALTKNKEALERELATLADPIANNTPDRERELEAAKQALAPLKARLSTEQENLDSLQPTYNAALAAKEARERDLAEKTQHIEKLRETHGTARADLDNVRFELNNARKAHDDALAELDSLQHQIADAKGSLDLIGDSSAELKKIANELETERILHSHSVKTEKEKCAPSEQTPNMPKRTDPADQTPNMPKQTDPADQTPSTPKQTGQNQPGQKTAPARAQHNASAQLAQTGVASGEVLLGAGTLIGIGALAAGVSRRRRQG
ncbi:hypothetical protein JTE88_00885 [Arcanobacterium phocisimile]|uniref:LPXTG-motif cell wall anchor domain-containing protein n=1 Tax=Arcanobacterium phocisimile TaxID=1302235 RepID=A0ABX7IGU7_9ACTO|nr:hypothetical protein [Arcanobacterium phocisimile]QRV02351.1 hypothetical protein JTE88_00885 [Arcanobacterium phocisimile]